MGRKRVILELSRGLLEAALISGTRVVRTYAEHFDASGWDEAWRQGLRPLDRALQAALAAVGAPRAAATVLHRGPDAVAQIYSYPTDPGGALGAAKLALADAVPYPLDENPAACVILGRDAAGDRRQTHVLGCADHARSAEAIVAWLERAGCVASAIIPADAVTLATLYRRLMVDPAPGVTFAAFLGEHGAAFASGEDGRLHFVRRVDLGLDLLVDAMMRPISARAGRPADLQLDRAEARAMLFRVGVPKPGAAVDESRGLTGADLLPVMQPVLQRYVVEARQSLRFGLSEKDRDRASIMIMGPGAAIPGVDRVLSAEIERPIALCERSRAFDPTVPCSPGGATRAVLDSEGPPVNLLPRRVADRIAFGRIQAGLLVGSAAAAIILALDAGLAAASLQRVRADLAAIEPAARQARAIAGARAEAAELVRDVSNAEARISAEVGRRPFWRATLAELSRRTPETVRLTELVGEATGADAVCRLRGHATGGAGREPRAALTSFIESLTACPLVASVEIGGTQRVQMEGADAQQFELVVKLVSVPFDPSAEAAQ